MTRESGGLLHWDVVFERESLTDNMRLRPVGARLLCQVEEAEPRFATTARIKTLWPLAGDGDPDADPNEREDETFGAHLARVAREMAETDAMVGTWGLVSVTPPCPKCLLRAAVITVNDLPNSRAGIVAMLKALGVA